MGILKPSITSGLLQLTPQFPPACSHLAPSPLHTGGGGDPQTYIAHWEWAGSKLEQAGSKLEQAGSKLGAGSELEQAGSELEQAGSKLEWAGSELEQAGVSLDQGEWSGSERSQLQLAPSLPPSPLPLEVVGTQIHTKLFIGHWERGSVRWEWQEWWVQGDGSDGSKVELAPTLPPSSLCPRGVGDPNTY